MATLLWASSRLPFSLFRGFLFAELAYRYYLQINLLEDVAASGMSSVEASKVESRLVD